MALVSAVRNGESDARRQFFDRHAPYVGRLLTRILGPDAEVADLIQDVFLMALRDLDRLRNPHALRSWLGSISVHVARGHLRHRKRRRWLLFLSPADLPTVPTVGADGEMREALRRVYALLDTLPKDERIAFALRIIEDMDLRDIADACGASLATIKRRIARAETAFVDAAKKDAVLQHWLEGGSRWKTA